jgi:hypothetical protein
MRKRGSRRITSREDKCAPGKATATPGHQYSSRELCAGEIPVGCFRVCPEKEHQGERAILPPALTCVNYSIFNNLHTLLLNFLQLGVQRIAIQSNKNCNLSVFATVHPEAARARLLSLLQAFLGKFVCCICK